MQLHVKWHKTCSPDSIKEVYMASARTTFCKYHNKLVGRKAGETSFKTFGTQRLLSLMNRLSLSVYFIYLSSHFFIHQKNIHTAAKSHRADTVAPRCHD